jgi:hypothetical protein
MAVSIKWYTSALKSAFNKEIDLDSDTIKCMLCTSSYTPNQQHPPVQVVDHQRGHRYGLHRWGNDHRLSHRRGFVERVLLRRR